MRRAPRMTVIVSTALEAGTGDFLSALKGTVGERPRDFLGSTAEVS